MNPERLIDLIDLDDPPATVGLLVAELRSWARRRGVRGAVVGVSGGVDSAVTLALAVRAFGTASVLALALPDRESSPLSLILARELTDSLGVRLSALDITPRLRAWNAYTIRDEAAREVFPHYDSARDGLRTEYRFALEDPDALPLFCLTLVLSDGSTQTKRLPPGPYRRIVAATNLKQRSRMTALYLEAERRGWAVVGTSNLLEIGQGFFVRHGDGGGDVFPLARLYKTQVYRLAEALNVPQAIIDRPPTTDTYSADQTQQEFFYGLPVRETDLMWAAFTLGMGAEDAASATGTTPTAAAKMMAAFERRRLQAGFLTDDPLAGLPVRARIPETRL